jgi:hypothetical protein
MAGAPLPLVRPGYAAVSPAGRRARVRLRAVMTPVLPADPAVPADELKIARQRMRHLTPWNVKPLPPMHSNSATPPEPLSDEARERLRQLALRVLAVQMWHAIARSALQ